jgi:hypothetical protein
MNHTRETTDPSAVLVTGVADTRPTPLGRLAAEGADTAARALRHVLPADEAGLVHISAFNAGI